MIDVESAQRMARRIAAGGEATLAEFRAEHPELRFYACSEDEVPPRLAPWAAADGVEVFLIDATEHCVRLSREPENACGLVFALGAEG